MVASAGSSSPGPGPGTSALDPSEGPQHGQPQAAVPQPPPSLQETPPPMERFPLDEDEIVISGISGRFPESADMNEFMDNLLNHVNMVTVNDRRFKPGLFGIPRAFGTLEEIDRFDADAFGMLPNQVKMTDPQLRMTLETTYEAICDAGVNPADQRGTRTGVFLGLCTSESFTLLSSDPNRIDGLALIGCSASMFANRISYAFDFKGPSCAYDTACSTSAFALEAAVSAMRAGKCDAAIVTASTLILTPSINVQFDRLGMLSKDSACKSFDKSGDGFARAEAVVTIFLQRASVAKRAYASILHIKTNTDGHKENGITFPSATIQEELLRSVYRESGINKDDVAYVEAHGTGTAAGDPQELTALSKIFRGRTRENPLLIGSVKSNMGHAEGASGLCSIAKIVVMLQTGVIPANLHFRQPAFGLNSVRNGSMKVVDENTEWKGGLITVNSFGFGGVNVHFVLKPWTKIQLPSETVPCQPRLVVFAGRDETGLAKALKKILEADDPNLCLLVNEMCLTPNPVTTIRGFAISHAARPPASEGEGKSAETILTQATSGSEPPLWLVFSGIGSQWIGMCRDLTQRLPIFAKSMEASARTLKERFNFDLHALLDCDDSQVYEHPTNCFVGITACQIGLIDVLNVVGVRPSIRGFLGHSAGEMACGYLDRCLTAEETIVMAYLRGASLEDTRAGTEPGAMAVVSLTWPQVQKLCPPGSGLHLACHNGLDSVTVAGTKPLVSAFVQEMKDKKKGVKEVNSSGVAFHSPYIATASMKFLGALREHLKRPLVRSREWISTSVPEAEWGSGLAAVASPEYFVNNFLSPVLFYEGLQHVPEGAVVLEVGPSGLLRGLIKRACPTATVIPLQARDSNHGLEDLLTALGKLYLTGVSLDFNKLFDMDDSPERSRFPVPLGTPFLSPLVAGAWNHSTGWEVPIFGMNGELQFARYEIDLASDADAFLAGHVVQGRILLPAMGYLCLVWRHFALTRQLQPEECPVVFENVRFNRVTVLGRRERVEFRIHISELSGAFEIKEGGAVVASGTVRAPDTDPAIVETRMTDAEFSVIERERMETLETGLEIDRLDGAQLYKRFRFYGFEYGGLFRGIQRADAECRAALVTWHGNWTAFMDTFLQTYIEPFETCQNVKLPTAITKLVVDPVAFLEHVANNQSALLYKDPELGIIKTHGIEMHWPKMTTVGRRERETKPELFSASFSRYFDDQPEEGVSPMLLCVSIAMENLPNRFSDPVYKMTVIEASPTEADLEESVAVEKLIRLTYGVVDMDYTIFAGHNPEEDAEAGDSAGKGPLAGSAVDLKSFDDFHKDTWLDKTYDIIILHNHVFLAVIAGQYLKRGKFMILKLRAVDEVSCEELLDKIGSKMQVVAMKKGQAHVIYLIRKRTKVSKSKEPPIVVRVSSESTEWVSALKEAIKYQEEFMSRSKELPPRIFLVSGISAVKDFTSGLRGLVTCLRKEPFSQNVRMIHSKMDIDLDFSHPSPELTRILQHDLVTNIFHEAGGWGFWHSCSPLGPEQKQGGKSEATTDRRQVQSAFVGMKNIGDLSSFRWIEGPDFKALPSKPSGLTAVDVHCAALNFKDIMLATGALPPPELSAASMAACPINIESSLGLEFAGVVVSKDGGLRRVCGYNEGQSLATQILAHEEQLWDVPSHWTLAEAATVPVVYATAYLALVERGRIRAGESLLIHSGAGGVGQAAIRIALSLGCTVFTTVGSNDKREFIQTQFPAIPASHIGNSRDCSFENLILRATRGRGVDVVLNSLSGEKLQASIRCLARHSRFLEIGKFDLVANKALGMELFLLDASFHGVMLDSLHDTDGEVSRRLHVLMQEGIDSGVVAPLPARVFGPEQVEPAFRYMGTGKHVGKILIQIRKEEEPEPSRILQEAAPRVYFDPAKSYIIAGGLGGIGLEFINWMIGRGARKLVVASRGGVKTAYQAEYLRAWRKHRNACIEVVKLDAGHSVEEADALLQHAERLGGPVDGFFNLAMQLELGFMKEQTVEAFLAVMNPKVALTHNIDRATRRLCPDMTHFVVFSSVIAMLGMPGQCNYGLANAAAEEICERRARDGLAGKAIELGPISEAGFFHETLRQNVQELTSYGGAGIQSISSVLRCMDNLLTASEPVVISRVNRELGPGECRCGSAAHSGGAQTLTDRMTSILGTNVSRLNPKTKLTELGLDSIMAMEVKQTLEQDFGLHLSATEIRTVTLEQLNEMSKNSEKNALTPGAGVGAGGRGAKHHTRAATADLFQFNFMRNSKKSRILYKQCVHPINKLAGGEAAVSSGRCERSGTVFICNSVEGPHILRILGSLIRRPAYSMQLPEDAPQESLKSYVDYYLKELHATTPKGPYVLAGYSAGALIAIELALRLQALGDEVQKLVLIDLTPGRADALLEENFGADRSKLDETHVLIAMLSQVLNIEKSHVEAVLIALPDRDSRIQKAIELGTAIFDEEVDFKTLDKLLGESQLKIANFFNHYKPSGTYHGKVALVRTTQNLISYDSNEFWGLEEFCSQTPEVHVLESTHSYLVAEPGVHHVAAVINNA